MFLVCLSLYSIHALRRRRRFVGAEVGAESPNQTPSPHWQRTIYISLHEDD